MAKKVKMKKLHKHISLGLVLLILVIIIGFLYFTHTNVSPKRIILNNTYSPSVMMPAVNSTYIDISVMDAKKLIDKNLNNPDFLIIDVSLNYNEGHIVNAVSYPIENDSFNNAVNILDKTKTYLVYGRNEIDSLNAAKELTSKGFEVYRLKGNYGAWVDIGYKIKNSY